MVEWIRCAFCIVIHQKKYLLLIFLFLFFFKNILAADPNDVCFRTVRLPNPLAYPFYGSPSPSEAYDSKRSHLYPFTCTPEEISHSYKPVLMYRSLDGLPEPYNLVTRDRNEIYVYGGSQGGIDRIPLRAYVAKMDADSLQETWRTYVQKQNESIAWNYPGVIAVDRNGYIYVIYSNYLKKLDPKTGQILKTLSLPAINDDYTNSTYNGLVFDDHNHLLAKSVNRFPGCTEDGFNAFINCDLSKASSILVSVNVNSLQIIDRVIVGENLGARLSYYQNKVYVAGGKDVFRYLIDSQGKFTFDEAWGKNRYVWSQQTAGTAPVIFEIKDQSYVVIQNNALPTTVSSTLTIISTSDPTKRKSIQLFKNLNIKSNESQVLQTAAIDSENQMIYPADGGYGLLAGVYISNDFEIKVKWIRHIKTYDFTILIGGKNNRELITTDLTKDNVHATYNWLDAKTGATKIESWPVVDGIGLPDKQPGYNGRFYQLGYDGVLSEWSFVK